MCDVVYAPHIRLNVIFVLGLMKVDVSLSFHELFIKLTLVSILFDFGIVSSEFIALDLDSCANYFMLSCTCDCVSIMNGWHTRVGHICRQRLQRPTQRDLLPNILHVELSTCVNCLVQKSTRKPFSKAPRHKFSL